MSANQGSVRLNKQIEYVGHTVHCSEDELGIVLGRLDHGFFDVLVHRRFDCALEASTAVDALRSQSQSSC